MKRFLNIILKIINIVSVVVLLLLGAGGIIHELFGTATYEKVLQKLNIPWSLEQILLFSHVYVIIVLIIIILREKFFDKER